LKAALNPATSDYLYYVRNPDRDDGAHNFYSNSAEFETGVQALRRWERERDEEEARKKRVGGN
jgi:cell division protein YceG involved in septum cleavage